MEHEQRYLESGATSRNKWGEIDRARDDKKREIFLLKCELAENLGSSGWNDVAQYILREDPRVQKFIVEEFMTLYNKRPRRYGKRGTAMSKRGRKSVS